MGKGRLQECTGSTAPGFERSPTGQGRGVLGYAPSAHPQRVAALFDACTSGPLPDSPHSTSDKLPAAAARADGDARFALFAPDAVFLRTDASERWTLQQFKAYAAPHFAAVKGLANQPWVLHIFAAHPRTVRFDDRLTNQKHGECRRCWLRIPPGVAARSPALPNPSRTNRWGMCWNLNAAVADPDRPTRLSDANRLNSSAGDNPSGR
ncbi:MAG: nuclear transport factor 2 family protein [Phycisphaerales bacterium]